MKTCPEVYQFLCDNLGHEIDSPECREIHRHLESCEECRRSLDGLRRTVTLFRTAPVPSVSPGVHSRLLRVLRTVRSEMSSSPRRRRASASAGARRGRTPARKRRAR